ncbi:MAG: hypothetical protein GXN91_01685 [Epsilonproteobacteria bacterium]|nr:hypothetical protein [Campylobacterota bacterium]
MRNLRVKILRVFLVLALLSEVGRALFIEYPLPVIKGVRKVVDRGSVGFEWDSVAKYPYVTGINIYRAKARPGINQVYTKIASIPNRFATHFVDTKIEPNTKYFYTFTTISGLNESAYGDIVPVKTKPPYKKVKVISAEVVAKDTVKILWVPSSEPQIYKYIIQRKKDNFPKWFYLDSVKGRLMPEYIDMTAKRGHTYQYRVIGVDANGLGSIVSDVLKVEVK